MTRFSISMSDALDFILHATKIGNGSEIFIPKLRAYSILDLKQALTELLGNTEEKIVGVRPGEKLHETLINNDEIRYGWEVDNMYMISNPLWKDWLLEKSYTDNISIPNAKKIENLESYSSNNVEKISSDELKKIIKDSGLID